MIKLPISDKVLDLLGFKPYHDKGGDWGYRSLYFKNGDRLQLVEYEETTCPDGPYEPARYAPTLWVWNEDSDLLKKFGRTVPGDGEIFFLHDLFDIIDKYYPNCLYEFMVQCNLVNIGRYIDEHIRNRPATQHNMSIS